MLKTIRKRRHSNTCIYVHFLTSSPFSLVHEDMINIRLKQTVESILNDLFL